MEMEMNKQAAVAFLELVVANRVEEAYERYVDMGGKHHNPYFPAGFPALYQAMKADSIQNPDKRLVVKNVLAEGDQVAVHSGLILGDSERALVHIFRFQEHRIVEMWDIGMTIPASSPNQDGAF